MRIWIFFCSVDKQRHDPFFRNSSITYLLATFIVSTVLHIIIHEGGHLLGGLLTGYKFVSFRVMDLKLEKTESDNYLRPGHAPRVRRPHNPFAGEPTHLTSFASNWLPFFSAKTSAKRTINSDFVMSATLFLVAGQFGFQQIAQAGSTGIGSCSGVN